MSDLLPDPPQKQGQSIVGAVIQDLSTKQLVLLTNETWTAPLKSIALFNP